MAYFMVHLCIAREIFERTLFIKDKGAFFLGAIAPDAIAFRAGSGRSDKKATHFYSGAEDWGDRVNCDEWNDNLAGCITKLKGQVDDDFLHGYYAHIITDIETTRHMYGPIRDRRDDKLMKQYQADCSAAEAVMLSRMGDKGELFALLHQANKHCLPDLINCRDVSLMLNYMEQKLYASMTINAEYRPAIYSLNDFDSFIQNAIALINRSANYSQSIHGFKN